jgi:flagellar protein FliS
VLTASQGQLIIMLYDEAVKNLDIAIGYIKENDLAPKRKPELIEKTAKAVIKAQNIVAELSASLDFDKGGDIARQLYSLYMWFGQEQLDANIHNDNNRIINVRDMLESLCESWRQIVDKNPQWQSAGGMVQGDLAERPSVNIAG